MSGLSGPIRVIIIVSYRKRKSRGNEIEWSIRRTLIKSLEVPSSENGRHDRNVVVELVMFEKNVAQETLEKLEAILSSKGWGNGVGRTGGEEGIWGMV